MEHGADEIRSVKMVGSPLQIRTHNRTVAFLISGKRALAIATALLVAEPASAKESELVPAGGNAYVTRATEGGTDRDRPGAGMPWTDENTVITFYIHIDKAAEVELALRAKSPHGRSRLRAEVAGKRFVVEVEDGEMSDVALGRVRTDAPGYLRMDLQGLQKSGPFFPRIEGVRVTPAASGVNLAYVKDNEDNRFYWGRRGPSVHLAYALPERKSIEWFYSEITVPEGADPIGSYFMANGFGEGYFGIQVNGPEERHVLFSVWSPFHTDNPRDVPEDQRIVLLAKGKDVRTGEFGNEGSGGQSYLIYPWQAGRTYRFLNRARPDGRGCTIYSAWFFPPEEGKWKLIASFRRPETDKHLTGVHSFLENFSDRNGWLERRAFYGNQWACDTTGKWHRLTRARFTGDDIARRGFRLDFAGGAEDVRFVLRNGGFFTGPAALDTFHTRKPGAQGPPEIRLEMLEGHDADRSDP